MQERFGVELDVDKAMQDMDTDGNGTLSQDELQAGMEAMRPSGPPPTGGMFGGYGPHGRPVNMNGAAASSQESLLLSLEA